MFGLITTYTLVGGRKKYTFEAMKNLPEANSAKLVFSP